MRPVCAYTDYFVVCTGGNPRQVKAIWDEVHVRLKHDNGLIPARPRERRGDLDRRDYIDVVLHVFTPEAREFYRLEDLWGDVPHESPSKQPRPRRPVSARDARGYGGLVELTTNQKGAIAESALVKCALEHGLDVYRPVAEPPGNHQRRGIRPANDFEFAATLGRLRGPIAQLGERLHGMQEVAGSSPAGSI